MNTPAQRLALAKHALATNPVALQAHRMSQNTTVYGRGHMTGRHWWFAAWVALVAFMLAAAPLAALTQSSAAATATRSSIDRGVTVKVTPKLIGSIDSRWEFIIVLETHSADLNDDLTQSATLTTNDGRTFKPTDWVGAGPTGHHREGVLAFEVPPPQPGAVELKIARPGESAPRTFRWQL